MAVSPESSPPPEALIHVKHHRGPTTTHHAAHRHPESAGPLDPRARPRAYPPRPEDPRESSRTRSDAPPRHRRPWDVEVAPQAPCHREGDADTVIQSPPPRQRVAINHHACRNGPGDARPVRVLARTVDTRDGDRGPRSERAGTRVRLPDPSRRHLTGRPPSSRTPKTLRALRSGTGEECRIGRRQQRGRTANGCVSDARPRVARAP